MRYGNTPEDISVDLRARLEPDGASERLSLQVAVTYSYMRTMIKRPLLEHAVVAEFEIPGLADLLKMTPSREKIAIPPSLMNLMLSVTIGSLRGMIAKRTAGTALEKHPLPLINISSLVSRLIYGEWPHNRVIPLEEPVCG